MNRIKWKSDELRNLKNYWILSQLCRLTINVNSLNCGHLNCKMSVVSMVCTASAINIICIINVKRASRHWKTIACTWGRIHNTSLRVSFLVLGWFTTLHFLCNLCVGPKSSSVTLQWTENAGQGQTFYLIEPIHKLHKK